MIKQTFRQINFAAFTPGRKGRTADESAPLTVTVSKRFGTLQFAGRTVRGLGMEGKLIHLFYEPDRKIIGWRIYTQSIELSKLKSFRLLKTHAKSGQCSMSIAPILNQMRLQSDLYSKLEVKKYVDQTLLNKGDTYFYVQLKEPDQVNDESDL